MFYGVLSTKYHRITLHSLVHRNRIVNTTTDYQVEMPDDYMIILSGQMELTYTCTYSKTKPPYHTTDTAELILVVIVNKAKLPNYSYTVIYQRP